MSADAYVSALTYYLPERVVTNEDLQRENPDWDMSRIAGKVGIQQRHIAGPNETSSDLAYSAGRRLLDGIGIDAQSIDAVIFCTQTPDYLPLVTIGKAGGALKSGQVVQFPIDTKDKAGAVNRPAADIYLTMAKAMGAASVTFPGQTGVLPGVLT